MTMSAAYNFLLKKYCGPLAVFMRKNWRFFESAVGMDPTSYDADKLVAFMIEYLDGNPFEKTCGDGDFKFYDGCLPSIARLSEAKVWREMASGTSYTPEEVQIVFLLVCGTIFTLRFIKNDLVAVASANPSGSNITINSNDICNSLLFRYCYYRGREEHDLLFRQVMRGLRAVFSFYRCETFIVHLPPTERFRGQIGLVTTGDDNIFARKKNLTWFNYDVIIKYMTEAGMIYTAADKSSVNVALKDVFDLSFLKRSFVFDGELKRWKMKIELKSIVKMLVFVKQSELSDTDHCAVLIGNACRELYFHGREIFEAWMARLSQVAIQCEVTESSLYKIFTYDELERRFLIGDYPKWLVDDRTVFFRPGVPTIPGVETAVRAVVGSV
jgi:hypothetical protein